MNTTATTYKPAQTVEVPDQIGTLPIFALMKDSMQSVSTDVAKKANTPEGKKTIGKTIYFLIFAAVVYFLYTHYTQLVDFMNGLLNVAWTAVWLTIPLGILIILYLMRNMIVGWMHQFANFTNRVVTTEIFKKDKAYIQQNAVATLNMKANEADNKVDTAEKSVTDVDAARLNALSEAMRQEKEEKAQLALSEQYNDKVKNEILPALAEAKAKGNSAKVSELTRLQREALGNATIAKSECIAAGENKRTYAQFANQVAKMKEILEDNAMSARIMAKALRSTVRIIEKKLETTTNINRATQNIAGAFDIKNSEDVNIAFDAVFAAIDQNFAQISTNLRVAEQGRGAIAGTISATELDSFVTSMKDTKPLNLAEVTSAAHELTGDEIVDPTFNILS